MHTSTKLLKHLSRNSDELGRIQQLYLEASGDIKPIYFYETYNMSRLGIFSKEVRSEV
jgi:hypothetical protein